MSAESPAHALLRPAIALPFLFIGLIWGSTWWVITDQLEGPPPSWSVAWRFLLATPAMFLVARLAGGGLRLTPAAHRVALLMGLLQFCANYNLIYRSEEHVTSGIVAVLSSLMIIPNAVLGWWLLGQRITPRFVAGSGVAIAGIVLLLFNEMRQSAGGAVGLGFVLALLGFLAAAIPAVIQAGKAVRGAPMETLVAWAMLYGAIADVLLAWWTAGTPSLPARPQYWVGVAYLALIGSVATFPLYYRLVRQIGAGRAAYSNILILIVAMLLSTVLEGYRWSALAIAGAMLAGVGLIVALRARNPVT